MMIYETEYNSNLDNSTTLRSFIEELNETEYFESLVTERTCDHAPEKRLSDYEGPKETIINIHESNNEYEIVLKVGDSFTDWDSVQTIIESYAKQNGFVANKCRKGVDPNDKSIIRRRDYICWKSGTHNTKKVEDINLHRDVHSKLIFIVKNEQTLFVSLNSNQIITIYITQKPLT